MQILFSLGHLVDPKLIKVFVCFRTIVVVSLILNRSLMSSAKAHQKPLERNFKKKITERIPEA